MGNLNNVETVLAVVRRAIRIDEVETRQRITFANPYGESSVIDRHYWNRHEQRCANLKLEERRLLDVLTQHYIHSPMKSVTVDMDGGLVCIPE